MSRDGDVIGLQHLFSPTGVVVVGSTAEGKLGYQLVRQIVDGGYRNVFAVNPKAQGIFSVPGYSAVSSIPQPVDLAVIVSPTGTVATVLEDCGQAGVKAAIIITAGFSETGNIAGEQEIKRVADQYGIRFVGPNCAGVLNTHHKLFPTLETRPPGGQVSFVAQSGAVGGVTLAWAQEYGLGFSKFVSYGNGADLNEIDFVRYLTSDPDTRVVALYLETVTNGRDFVDVVHECSKHKPVVVIKAGRTQTGRRAALSHTGSMAGSDAVYDAALQQCGAIRVYTIDELFDLCKAFVHLPPLRGRKVVIVTNSGGPGVLAADHADELGLNVVEPSQHTQQRLSEFLPSHCPLNNPIDLTVEGTEAGYHHTLLTVLPEYDAALALNIAPAYLDSVPLARGIADAADETGKPVIASFLPGRIVGEAIAELEKRGIPNIATGERAVTALAHMARYGARKAALGVLPDIPRQRKALPGDGQMLEPEAMRWLQANGIPVPQFRFATSPSEAVEACHEISYPVVIKVVSPQILHKSDVGGVALNIHSDREAIAAFETMRCEAADKDFRGVVIYPLIVGAQEVLLGLTRDPQFGPVVAFGLGGIYTEIWSDVALRLAPLERTGAMAMIQAIKSYPLLTGTRGREPCDLDALADVLVRFSQLPFHYRDIVEVDLNPVFLFSEGLLVGDVRVIRRSETNAEGMV